MLEAPVKTFLCKPLPAVMETARDGAAPSPARLLSPISSTTPSGRQQMTLEEEEGDSRPSPGPAEEDIAPFFMTQVRTGCQRSGLQGLSRNGPQMNLCFLCD